MIGITAGFFLYRQQRDFSGFFFCRSDFT